ncbi:protein kinase family protein / peptidoglycan-binding LysM domain-containing protein [Prunus dulcis]|uniref:Protein kinase family protein / peptidoglycan-binding LysM domain-containing protein n=1 Tax=Prunus dulcis TaxID=3755 RepID=A0A4Y1RI59_PRUDU|nr:protein kinase family protein / peptidoglycan-binding LysM domain-containing protein [Prunus dulcis]
MAATMDAFFEKQEVAIKKMRSIRTKEFFAELKVLCKIHHNNVNGSLNDHLHDPLLKGSQTLLVTCRKPTSFMDSKSTNSTGYSKRN